MISRLSIQNFKSIKNLSIKTGRVNVFHGKHNSGKSNLLEALSWFSINALDQGKFQEIFRLKTATDLFYDFDATQPIQVKTDDLNLIIRYARNTNGALMNRLEGLIYPDNAELDVTALDDFQNLQNKKINLPAHKAFTLSFDGEIESIGRGHVESSFRTYIFKKLKSFERNFQPFLNPPFGENVPSLLISNKHYKDLIGSVFKEKGFRLMLKPTEGDINMAKDINDELYSYPYTSISETLQRIVFYLLAIESNKNATLILDEPESNTFPMYTKQMAELIGLDSSNQYFIATHNPYLLNSLVTKTPAKDLSVFVAKMDQYKTNVVKIQDESLSTILDKGVDVYFNLDELTANNG